jgi:hypothetical protein
MSRSLRAAALLAVTVVLLPALAHGQILTKDGDPVATVTDAAKAVPAGKTQGKAPALKAGQRVLLLVEKDGMALVCAEAPGPGAGIFDEYRYRLPLAAVAFLPGKTHRGRPAWLPVPGPAEAARRDVVAYEQGDAIFVRSGEGPPKRVAKGTRPALSPDGARLAYTPEKGAGLMLVSLDGDARPMRIGDGKEPVRQKAFCPDGSKLAWLVDRHVEVLDLARPGAAPTTAASGLEPGAALQGFAKACDALVLRNGDTVQWVEIAGKTLRSVPAGAFTNGEEGSGSDRYVPSPAEANLLLVAGTTRGTDAYHRWANDTSGALYLYDAASGTNHRLTPRHLAAVTPSWSPDGKRVYFSALPDAPPHGPHHLYRINADGTGPTDLGPGFAPSVGTRPQE